MKTTYSDEMIQAIQTKLEEKLNETGSMNDTEDWLIEGEDRNLTNAEKLEYFGIDASQFESEFVKGDPRRMVNTIQAAFDEVLDSQ